MPLRRTGLTVLAAVALVGMAGCTAATSPGHSARRTARSADTVPPPVQPTAPASMPQSLTTPKPAYPACTAGQLSGQFTGGVGAGSAFTDVMLTNASDQPCTLSGWPKEILGVGASGALAVVSRGPFLAGPTPGAANLQQGNTGELVLNYGAHCGGPAVSKLVVVLANGGRVTVASSARYPWRIPTGCGAGIGSFGPVS